jgi:DHA2 family multidrug resistance protein-like MFS transporter
MTLLGGAAIGPEVGGVLLSRFWWGSVFLLGVPAMVLLLVAGPLLLPEHRSAAGGRLDLVSVAESLAAILPVVYGVKELARGGLQPVPAAAIVVGVVAGAVFVRRQRSLAQPLLNVRLFANREFSVVLAGMLLSTMLGGGVMVAITQGLQLVEGLSPLAAGLWMLPAVAASIAGFQVSPLAARRVRPAALIGLGLTITIAGLLVITRVGPAAGAGSLATLVTGFALLNLGVGPLVTLGTNLVVSAAPPSQAGAAGAIAQTSNELGFALGVALLGSLGAAVYRAGAAGSLPAGSPPAAYDTMAGAAAAAVLHPALLAPARAAFTSGLQVVAAASAVLLVGVAATVVWQLRHVGRLVSAAAETARAA